MGKIKKNLREFNKPKSPAFHDSWDKKNFLILFIGTGLLVLGYFLMTISPWDNIVSLSLSPVVLIVAYLVIIPFSILFKPSNKKNNVSSEG